LAGWYHWVLPGTILFTIALAALLPASQGRLRGAFILVVLSFLGMLVCGLMRHGGATADQNPAFRYTHLGSQLLFALGIVNLASVLAFRVLLPPMHLSPPPILRDTIAGVAYIVVALVLLSHHGTDVGGIIAT